MSDTMDPMATDVDQQELVQQLLAQAREQGIDLVGPDGLLNRLTKNVLETALEAEMDEHLGYEKHDVSGRGSGNSRNGTRSKTVLTEIGPVEIIGEMTEWQNRPLDRMYPVMFIDAIHVKIRDGQVTKGPVYIAIGVRVNGERDILGLWAGDGGEGAKFSP